MGVEDVHPQYAARAAQWRRCRDVIAGQEAMAGKPIVQLGVVAAGTKSVGTPGYLPRLKDQDGDEYNAYVARTLFFNATQRTVEGLTGMVFRNPPKTDAPEALLSMLEDVTMGGVPFEAFAETVTEDVLSVGRYGFLVDYPRVDNTPATRAEAEAAGNRPFMIGYPTESILDWKQQRIANMMTLTQVRLLESVERPIDEFTTECIPQIRVLDLVNGQYQVRLYQQLGEGDQKKWGKVGETIVPLKNGAPLTEIPFVFVGVRDLTPTCSKPPLMDMVETNIDHYRMMADYRHGLHFTGLPTPVVSGYNSTEGESLYIGSTKAWVFPDPHAKAAYLEFTGTGLTALKEAIGEDEERMAAQGARMLAPEKKATETAETASIHRAGEASVLASMAGSIGRALTRGLEFMRDWAGLTGDVRCELNTDYFPLQMTPQQLLAYVSAWQQGAISAETLFYNLQYGETYPEGLTFEDEQAKIANSPPLALQMQEKLLEAPLPDPNAPPQKKAA